MAVINGSNLSTANMHIWDETVITVPGITLNKTAGWNQNLINNEVQP